MNITNIIIIKLNTNYLLIFILFLSWVILLLYAREENDK